MTDDWKSSIVDWLKDHVDLATGGLWLLLWTPSVIILLTLRQWDLEHTQGQWVCIAWIVGMGGATALIAKGILKATSSIAARNRVLRPLKKLDESESLVMRAFIDIGVREMTGTKLIAQLVPMLREAQIPDESGWDA